MIRITIQNDDHQRVVLNATTTEHDGEPCVCLRNDYGDPNFGGHECTWRTVLIELAHSGWEIVEISDLPSTHTTPTE